MPRRKKGIDPKHPHYQEDTPPLDKYWEKEATDMNRELAKRRDNGKTEYVQPHMRGESIIDGYFRKPPWRGGPKERDT